jgi:hypothetical protein
MPKKLQIKEGEKLYKLTVIKETEPYISPKGIKLRKALFVCECGELTNINYSSVKSGEIKSCGCLQSVARKHGSAFRGKQTTEYRAWCSMKYRCLNPNSKDYYLYGAKDIKIYDKWINSFESFLEHVGTKPSKEYSLDRIDPSGNYEPNNVRWATAKQQRMNQNRMK